MYQKGRLGFGLDSFDSELNLQYDIEYNTVADLKKVLEYYLSVTISHALPLLSRLPYPVPEVTHENQKKFATDTMGKAASWADKHGVPIAINDTTLNAIQNYLESLRGSDYSKKHFDDEIDNLLEVAAYFGESVRAWRAGGNWIWNNSIGEGVFQILYPEKARFDAIGAIWSWWCYTPEFTEYSIYMFTEYLRRKLD